jgi:hypothetical protein
MFVRAVFFCEHKNMPKRNPEKQPRERSYPPLVDPATFQLLADVPAVVGCQHTSKAIGCSLSAVYNYLAADELESILIGSRRLVTTRSIAAFLQRRVAAGTAARPLTPRKLAKTSAPEDASLPSAAESATSTAPGIAA